MVCSNFAVAILWPLIAPLEDASIVYIGSRPVIEQAGWYQTSSLLFCPGIGPRNFDGSDVLFGGLGGRLGGPGLQHGQHFTGEQFQAALGHLVRRPAEAEGNVELEVA